MKAENERLKSTQGFTVEQVRKAILRENTAESCGELYAGDLESAKEYAQKVVARLSSKPKTPEGRITELLRKHLCHAGEMLDISGLAKEIVGEMREESK